MKDGPCGVCIDRMVIPSLISDFRLRDFHHYLQLNVIVFQKKKKKHSTVKFQLVSLCNIKNNKSALV